MPTSIDDLVGNVVHHVLGALEPDFSFGSLDMYPFQNVVLPSDENLLEVIASSGFVIKGPWSNVLVLCQAC